MIDKFLSPKFVLVAFAIAAIVGFLIGKLSQEFFSNALIMVLSYYYGSKNGEAAAKAKAAGISVEG